MINPEEIIKFILNNSENLYNTLWVYEFAFNSKNAIKFLNLLKQNWLECKNIELLKKDNNVFNYAYWWFNTKININENNFDYLDRNIMESINYINNTNFTIPKEMIFFNIVWDYRIIEPEIIYKIKNGLKK